MGLNQWNRIEELFHQTVDLDPAERALFLDKACAGDDELRRSVEGLIDADAGEDRFKGTVARALMEIEPETENVYEVIGKRIGKYSILSLIGEGGIGAVYRAMREEEPRKEVAIKLLKAGTETRITLRRFRLERQILAGLQHANIAQLMDAGATDKGLPYFVMEYVNGAPLLEYSRALSVRQRLELFRTLCSAVQYAHQRLVIHRDLKPANILVTREGVPKLLDFGIAKMLDPAAEGTTSSATAIGMRMLTPDYASPEQVRGEPVTTATDIYSMGAVLYELLTGQPAQHVSTSSPVEIEKIVCTRKPNKPSAVNRELDSDLDRIVLKALRKEPGLRYSSIEYFSDDIRLYLEGRPVSARDPTVWYRLGKFARRNRLGVALGSALAASVLIGAIASFTLYLRAEVEKERAEAQSYAANLAAAADETAAGRWASAETRLYNVNTLFRGWEWRHLMARMDQSTATLYLRAQSNVAGDGSISFSGDGTQALVYAGTTLRFWDLATHRALADFSVPGRIMVIEPNSNTALVAPPLDVEANPPVQGPILRLYDVRTNRVLVDYQGLETNCTAAAISAGGLLVAAASAPWFDSLPPEPRAITVWNGKTGKIIARLDGHRTMISGLAFSPDGRFLASASADHTVRTWQLGTGRSMVLQHSKPVSSVAFSSDGTLIASPCEDGTISVWQSATGRLLARWRAGKSGQAWGTAFSPDGRLLASASAGGGVQVWETLTGNLRQTFNGHEFASRVAFHPTRPRLYSGSTDGIFKEWSLEEEPGIVREPSGPVSAVAISRDGKYLAYASNAIIRVYDSTARYLLRTLGGHGGDVLTIAFSPDSSLLASGSEANTIDIWNVSNGELVRTLAGHNGSIRSVEFDKDAKRLVSGSVDQTIRVWNVNPPGPLMTIATTSRICKVAISPDGTTIAALRQHDGAIALWDVQSGKPSGTFELDIWKGDPNCGSMMFSQDGRLLVSAASDLTRIAIWDFPKRSLKQLFSVFGDSDETASDYIASLALSPDNSRIAIGSLYGGNITLMDARRGSLLVSLPGHTEAVSSLAWSSDGARIASGSLDGTIRLWDSKASYPPETRLLVTKAFDQLLLVEDVLHELRNDRSISPELRDSALKMALELGNVPYYQLFGRSWKVGESPRYSRTQYIQALRWAAAAVHSAPWNANCYLAVALLQYRIGDFHNALASAHEALTRLTLSSPRALAIRAMAYYKLDEIQPARNELARARSASKTVDSRVAGDDWASDGLHPGRLLEEAETIVSARR
jgi:serine/threonine-protein kinase